jgi:hypothetical protein
MFDTWFEAFLTSVIFIGLFIPVIAVTLYVEHRLDQHKPTRKRRVKKKPSVSR